MAHATEIDPLAVARALRSGPATLSALDARLHGPDREALTWALEDATRRGWVHSTADLGCPDGVCGDAPPTLLTLTDDGRAALRAAGR
ncbi:hypothetical protein [Conexibacter sp. SYSU D00693]|uniref:hypothetical protein n=1 Tax=Conexibacter sp. SYSU D00693 TaxID=2812560 RepID=UPI00196B6269|nr:hypothetical protein [Conexibacter sp. SYSU D00693]